MSTAVTFKHITDEVQNGVIENEGLIEQFIEKGIFEDTKERVAVGYVVCPILRYMPY